MPGPPPPRKTMTVKQKLLDQLDEAEAFANSLDLSIFTGKLPVLELAKRLHLQVYGWCDHVNATDFALWQTSGQKENGGIRFVLIYLRSDGITFVAGTMTERVSKEEVLKENFVRNEEGDSFSAFPMHRLLASHASDTFHSRLDNALTNRFHVQTTVHEEDFITDKERAEVRSDEAFNDDDVARRYQIMLDEIKLLALENIKNARTSLLNCGDSALDILTANKPEEVVK